MSTKSLLTNEEIIMLRTKFIPDIHKEYKDVVDSLNLVATALKSIDGDELYIDNATQIRLLKKMGKQVIELEVATKEMKRYLRKIAIRLELI